MKANKLGPSLHDFSVEPLRNGNFAMQHHVYGRKYINPCLSEHLNTSTFPACELSSRFPDFLIKNVFVLLYKTFDDCIQLVYCFIEVKNFEFKYV